MTSNERLGWNELGARIDPKARVHETAVIMPEASVGPDATIEANVIVGRGATVEAGATLRMGVIVGENARIGEGASIAEAEIGARSVVGKNTRFEADSAPYREPHTNRTTASLIETHPEDGRLNHVATGDVREMRTLMNERRTQDHWSARSSCRGCSGTRPKPTARG